MPGRCTFMWILPFFRIQQLKYQNGGVLEEGVNYASLTDYRKAKGISTGGSGSEGGEGEGEDPSV